MNRVEKEIQGKPFLIMFEGPIHQEWWVHSSPSWLIFGLFARGSRSTYYISCLPEKRTVELTVEDQRHFRQAYREKNETRGVQLVQELLAALHLVATEQVPAFVQYLFRSTGVPGWEQNTFAFPLPPNQQSVILSPPKEEQHADL